MSLDRFLIGKTWIEGPKLSPKLSVETDKFELTFFICLFKLYFKNDDAKFKLKIFEYYVDKSLKDNYNNVIRSYLGSLKRTEPIVFDDFIEKALKIFYIENHQRRIICDYSEVNQQSANQPTLEHLCQINQTNLENVNSLSSFYKFQVEQDLRFSIINVLTGKCGSGKSEFLNRAILYSNPKVLTFLRNSLISMKEHDYVTEEDKLNKIDKNEVKVYQQWLCSNKDILHARLPENIPFSKFELNISADRYFTEKEKSPLTYSNLYFLLQYFFNRALKSQTFLIDLNNYLSENQFQYKLILKNETFFIQKVIGTLMTISHLSQGEMIEFYLLLLGYAKELFLKKNPLPKLLPCAFLLDEIDSNCEPILIKKIVDGLSLLANFFKIQIFTVTHNPATISFLALEQLYRIEKRIERDEIIISLRKAKSKGECIFGVTENILLVNEPFKEVFVEGALNNDKKFYEWVLKKLKEKKTSSSKKLNYDDVQVYIHQMGDCRFCEYFRIDPPSSNQVKKKNEMLNVFGLIDCDGLFSYLFKCYNEWEKDQKKEIIGSIKLLEKIEKERSKYNKNLHIMENRYTLENQIYDPIYIYFALINEARQPQAERDKKFLDKLRTFFDDVYNENLSEIINQDTNLEQQLKNDPVHFKEKCQNIVNSFGIFIRSKINKKEFFEEINPDLFKNIPEFKNFKNWFYSDESKNNKVDVKINENVSILYDPIILFHHGKNIQKILHRTFENISVFKHNECMLKKILDGNFFVFSDIEKVFSNICEAEFYKNLDENQN